MRSYLSDNVYLCSFISAHDGYTVGKVAIPENSNSKRASIEILYLDEKSAEITDLIKDYDSKRAVCNINRYQGQIRFIIALVNKAKATI